MNKTELMKFMKYLTDTQLIIFCCENEDKNSYYEPEFMPINTTGEEIVDAFLKYESQEEKRLERAFTKIYKS